MTDIKETGNEGENPEETVEETNDKSHETESQTDDNGDSGDNDSLEDYISKEDFNKVIQKRLSKQEEKIRAEYEGFEDFKKEAERVSELEESLSAAKKQYDEVLAEKVKLSVLQDYGFQKDALELLTGNTEEEVKESAEKLKKLISSSVGANSADASGKQYGNGAIKDTDPHLAKARAYFQNK